MFKSIATAALAVSFAGAAMAEEKFTGATFLAWAPNQQAGYVTTSLNMAAALAPSRADCILGWNTKARSDNYIELKTAIGKYPNYHPTGVLVALLEQHCGQLTMAQK